MAQNSEKTYYMYLSPAGDVWSLTPIYSHLKHTEEIIQCNIDTCFEETQRPFVYQSFDDTYHEYKVLNLNLETFYLKKASIYGTLVNCYVHSKLNNPEGMQRIVNYFENMYKRYNNYLKVKPNLTAASDASTKTYVDSLFE